VVVGDDDPYGERISLTDTRPGQAAKDFSYGYDVHGSISELIDDAGQAQAAYGYTPYGDPDTELSYEQDPYAGSQQKTAANEPLNPYRYSNRRLDLGSERADLGGGASSGGYDMGARRFGPDIGRFLQPDVYQGAMSDLSLSEDDLASNRFALAGGNPVSFVEDDGHMYQRETVYTRDGTTSPLGRATPQNAGLRRQQRTQQRVNRSANSAIRQASDDGGGLGPLRQIPGPARVAARELFEQASGTAAAAVVTRHALEVSAELRGGMRLPGLIKERGVRSLFDLVRGGRFRGGLNNRVGVRAQTRFGTELRGAARAGASGLKPLLKSGVGAGLGQAAFDSMSNNDLSTGDRAGRAAVAAGAGVGGAAAGAAAAGLACGPGAPLCSVALGGGTAFAVATGLDQVVANPVSKFLGFGDLDE
jgi:hypothetical protein